MEWLGVIYTIKYARTLLILQILIKDINKGYNASCEFLRPTREGTIKTFTLIKHSTGPFQFRPFSSMEEICLHKNSYKFRKPTPSQTLHQFYLFIFFCRISRFIDLILFQLLIWLILANHTHFYSKNQQLMEIENN